MPKLGAYAGLIRHRVSAYDAGIALMLKPNRDGRCQCPVHHGRDRNCKLYIGETGYHCFVCGAHGDVIDLVRHVQGCSFADAVRWLDDAFNLMLPLDRAVTADELRAARDAVERRKAELKKQIEAEEVLFNLFCCAAETVQVLEDEVQRYAPKPGKDEWDPGYADAVNRLTTARGIAEELLTLCSTERVRRAGQ